MIKKLLFFALSISLASSCGSEEKVNPEIAAIALNLEIKRFDLEFANAVPSDLPGLKNEYPYLFPETYPDSIWISRMRDTLQQEINTEVKGAFPDFTDQEEDLNLLFRHISHYFPGVKVPKVITLVSDVDYQNKIVYADSLLLVAIDTYLGEGNRLYQGISKFQRANMNPGQIAPDVVTEFSRRYVSAPVNRSFLAQMVYYGKQHYLKDLLLPLKSDADKMGYTQQQIDWANDNEEEMWRYFVEGELLFSNDASLPRRFITNAPFSKFYKEIDNDSPGRIGQWLGWQIVRAYMKNNDVSFQEMLVSPAEEIFNKSKYKPKK